MSAICAAAMIVYLTGPGAAAAPSLQRDFLSQNASAPGVQAAPALEYRILKSGPVTGLSPTCTSAVKLRYEGRYIDGTVFDSWQDKPLVLRLKWLIPGFVEALMMMKPGDQWEVVVPPELAYGWVGDPPAGRTLVFRIELIDWSESPTLISPLLPELPAKAPTGGKP